MISPHFDELDIYVWEGKADIHERVARCMASFDAEVVRADGMASVRERGPSRIAVAVISVSVIDSAAGMGPPTESLQGMPVVWVAGASRDRTTTSYPPEYLHILPYDFTGAELRTLVTKLVKQLRAQVTTPDEPGEMIAHSEAMRALIDETHAFADCDHNVLVRGETGAGKERIAQELHRGHGRYGKGPFVAVNCGAIPDGLFESLFFGHAKGSFTGAIQAHRGYFEQATGGTLFLDEIGDLPRYQQVKLLRVIEDNAVTRLGASVPIKLDFRLVAATNRDLRQMVDAGDFRADLFYRLAVIELYLPSLEERGMVDKIAIFNAVLAGILGERMTAMEPLPYWLTHAVSEMYFPGNVRQLRNLAERVGVVVQQTNRWDQPMIQRALAAMRGGTVVGALTPADVERDVAPERRRWDGEERNRIIEALEANDWRRQDTAQQLGISRKVLWEKMRKYQINEGEPKVPQG